MHSADYAVARCLSVCPSARPSHASIVSKRLHIGLGLSSKFIHRRVAPPFQFFHTKRDGSLSTAGECTELWLACRHHMHEILLSDVFTVCFGPSSGPEVIFKRFREKWDNLSSHQSKLGTTPLISASDSLKSFITDELKQKHLRDDYLELITHLITDLPCSVADLHVSQTFFETTTCDDSFLSAPVEDWPGMQSFEQALSTVTKLPCEKNMK